MAIWTPIALASDVARAASNRSLERRILMLRRATHLLLSYERRLNDHQLDVFDGLLVGLLDWVDTDSLVQLSLMLADLPSAPRRTIRQLACHPNTSVAAPVLHLSRCLSNDDLCQFARELNGEHLVWISSRSTLDEALTDALLDRCSAGVCRALAKNVGARFSTEGYSAIVAAATLTPDIAESLALRPDISPLMLRQLLSGMSDQARLQLIKAAPPGSRADIRDALDQIATHISEEVPEPVIYSDAEARVRALTKSGKLNDSAVSGFAMRREYTNIIAALTVLSGASLERIEPLMEDRAYDGLVVACRAARLNWQTTLAVLRSRNVPQPSTAEIATAKKRFETLNLSIAQRTIRFGLG